MRAPRRCHLEAYLGRLFGYGLSLANDREQARDLVQECALKALAAKRVPRDEAAYRAWLFRILRNAFLDRQRRRDRLGTAVDLDQVDMADGETWHTDDRMISALTVRLGMAKLSPDHREVLAVVDIGGFSYAEAATFLGVPVGTVMSRLCRARRALLRGIGESKVRAFPGEARRAAE